MPRNNWLYAIIVFFYLTMNTRVRSLRMEIRQGTRNIRVNLKFLFAIETFVFNIRRREERISDKETWIWIIFDGQRFLIKNLCL